MYVHVIHRLTWVWAQLWNINVKVNAFYMKLWMRAGSVAHSSLGSTPFALCPVGPLWYRSSLTWACLQWTAFIPWATIPHSATSLLVLCCVWVCHPKAAVNNEQSEWAKTRQWQGGISAWNTEHTGLWVKEMLKSHFILCNEDSLVPVPAALLS